MHDTKAVLHYKEQNCGQQHEAQDERLPERRFGTYTARNKGVRR
ncbi:hypothetical protein GCM10027414_36540 [Humibacter ginsengiterrae]